MYKLEEIHKAYLILKPQRVRELATNDGKCGSSCIYINKLQSAMKDTDKASFIES